MNHNTYLLFIVALILVFSISVILVFYYKKKYEHQNSRIIQLYLNGQFVHKLLLIISNSKET
ncbi:MAG: hypothetical protein KA998_04325 [Rickettsiaceae bacterium]|nr:hypothetical protein [Rickettsiaceae bacterium]